ncbi:hypothetical protein [Halonatronum saccharophilum]|uniref:hypothetical protein n=1 Tax=Halonatronum saccharophilum TaxID=150060 RepID=UPI00047F77BD|nr:hypothetical protein [Halonatronum saccharophilum]
MCNNKKINKKIKRYVNLILSIEDELIKEFDKENRDLDLINNLHQNIEKYCRELELTKRVRRSISE